MRLCGVGPNKTFEQALREILPNADWDILLSRTQQEKEEGFYRVAAGGRASAGTRARKSPQKGKNGGKKDGNAVAAPAERDEVDSDSEQVKEQNENEDGKDASVELADDGEDAGASSATSRRQDDDAEREEGAEQGAGEQELNRGVAPVKAEGLDT